MGWLTLVAPVTAQEAAPEAEPPVATPAVMTAPAVANDQPSDGTSALVAPAETTAVTATETNAETGSASADPTTASATNATTNQVATLSVSTPAIEPQPAATNISALGINGLPAVTNAPLPDPRAGDAPGWWFEAARKQGGEYPAFLGIRFADVSRAIIIETPNRKLTVGQPLVYRLWVCNDLPQAIVCRVEYAVRKGEIVISQTNALNFMVKGSEAQAVDRFKQSTDALAPGTYTIDATLRDQTGKLLHHMTETVELTAPKSP
ncbi:MAG: hypothetical protein ABIJ53_06515 [Verrucomicrobiota bacterium]